MTKSLVENRLRELGIDLPEPPKAVGAYVPVIRTGNLIVTSGQLPWKKDRLAFSGKLGTDLTVEQGSEASRLCAINAIAQLKVAAGDLDRVRQIVRVEGYVHCGPGFREHPQVLNGASDLLNAVFGERGRHTRTALGIHEMPLDSPVQLIVWAEVE
ncbi:MAG: RidA family protein [Planctomycetes bacterium]|nr:RidA family protein [Planctomycetota bacterium]